MDLTDLSIREAHDGLKTKKFAAKELALASLNRIKELDDTLQAFITVCENEAMKKAEVVDKKISEGEKINVLSGIPYSAKDLFCTRGIQTTAGSKILEGFVPPYNASVIEKLENLDAVLMGKNTEDEFGHGISSENTGFKVPRNPIDPTRTAGGSSGGSAAAVKSNEVFFSLGTDTGGSVRQPASMCGIVGLKPSYGRISRYGVIAMASSLDTVGILARNVEDVAYVLENIAGQDRFDATTVPKDVPKYSEKLDLDLKNIRIGMPKEYFTDDLPKDISEVVKKAILDLEKKGAKIQEISLPHTKYGVAVYYIVCPCEVSANMSRYDGIRFGPTIKDPQDLEQMYLENRTKFHPEVKRRIMIGTYALSSGYYDAYYLKAQKVRTLILKDFEEAFKHVDVICCPTAPYTAFKEGEKTSDPLTAYLSDVFTIPASLAGLCSLNMPCGEIDGLPVGMQIIGPQFGEERILGVGAKVL
ncbi:glutaminyl-tRNA synthase (glutamine-hydrolyzing) subunit A [Candidatus Peregrinibacteria bacterium RIFOXYA2_FULL_33_7]|nr:MAG: glutaminyl-tRNA synthase (glutamine-hydrolyzing) subunit A [Candidatus Peregrinibacteria bacterium RIFOXYA2_FULL_33_7]